MEYLSCNCYFSFLCNFVLQCKFCIFVSHSNEISRYQRTSNKQKCVSHWIHQLNFPKQPYKYKNIKLACKIVKQLRKNILKDIKIFLKYKGTQNGQQMDGSSHIGLCRDFRFMGGLVMQILPILILYVVHLHLSPSKEKM